MRYRSTLAQAVYDAIERDSLFVALAEELEALPTHDLRSVAAFMMTLSTKRPAGAPRKYLDDYADDVVRCVEAEKDRLAAAGRTGVGPTRALRSLVAQIIAAHAGDTVVSSKRVQI